MSTTDQVSRFCPECGQRVRADESMFVDPQICPKCKTRVMFLDHPPEMPPVEDDGAIVEPRKLLKLEAKIAAASVVLLLGGFAVLAAGSISGVPVVLLVGGLLMLAAGILGVAVFLDHRSKLKKITSAYENCSTALRDAAKKNREVVSRYHNYQISFGELVAEAKNNATAREEAAIAQIQLRSEELKHLHFERQAELETEKQKWIQQIKESEEKATKALASVVQTKTEYESYRKAVYAIAQKVGNKYLEESKRNIKSRLTINNFGASRERLIKAAEFLEKQGCAVDREDLDRFVFDLKHDFEELVRIQAKREEQAIIKERIRDEERARVEIERELKRVAAERAAIEKAIAEVLARTKDEHSAEVEMLRAKLAEAEERSQRALSMAQQTKSGNVYVISNIGSFGERVFKVGMTRRLEPLDRVKELGDASVPFPFDVHMMIFSEDAPGLESAIHRKLNHCRVNRINVRKEFFRVDLEEIVKVVEAHKGKVEYVAEPEALEYRESLLMTDADVDAVFSNAIVETLDDDDN